MIPKTIFGFGSNLNSREDYQLCYQFAVFEDIHCSARSSLIMDPQIRNFRDFLQLYNKITELCFSQCADNFFSRELSRDESNCLDRCVQKFTRVNQRIMNVYVEVQTGINERRVAELEAQAQTQAQAEQQTPIGIETEPISQLPNMPETARPQDSTKLTQDTESDVR